MNSKEALRTIERYIEYNCDEELEIVFKDLYRLEKFAHENASLHTEIDSLHTENESLQSENAKLKKIIYLWRDKIKIRLEPDYIYTYAKFTYEEFENFEGYLFVKKEEDCLDD